MTTQPTHESGYRGDVDGLRAIAVLAVILYHAFPRVLPGGFIGVDVFFVISGYLISRVILRGSRHGSFRFSDFYARRVRRILPALLVMMLTVLATAWVVLTPSELALLGNATTWSALFAANRYFGTSFGGYFDNDATLNPLLHLWSLGIEEQFYLLWPLLLLGSGRIGIQRTALTCISAVSFGFAAWGAWHEPAPYFYALGARAWELALGGLLACSLGAQNSTAGIHPGSHRGVANAAAGAGMMMIIAAAVLTRSPEGWPGCWALVPCMGSVLLIGSGEASWLGRRVLSARPMVYIGRRSYSLYLWHWPLLAFARVILGRWPSTAATLGIIAATFAISALTYRAVEQPIRFGSRGVRAVVPLLAASLVIAGLGYALGHHRLTGRMGQQAIASLEAAAFDWSYPGDSNFGRASSFTTVAANGRRASKVVFIGDSHIEHYWPRVEYVLQRHPDSSRSAIFATYIGCPPLPGINSVRHTWSDCPDFLEFALRQAHQPDVDTVVFGAFWELYFMGEFARRQTSQIVYRAGDPLRRQLDMGSPATAAAIAGFGESVRELVSSGRRVYVILSNPTSPEFDPLSLISPRLRLGLDAQGDRGHEVTAPAVDVTPFERYVATITQQISAAATRAGATVIDPRISLCEGYRCPVRSSSGEPLYMDSNHLRPFYARERAVFIDEILLGTHDTAPTLQSRS